MRRIWLVLRREYLENVRTKAFVVGLLLTPIWMGLIFLASAWIESEPSEKRRVVIVDTTHRLAAPLATHLAQEGAYQVEVLAAADPWTADADGLALIDDLRVKAGRGDLYAIVLTPAILEKRRDPPPDERPSQILGASRSTDSAIRAPALLAAVNEVVNAQIVRDRGLDPDLARLLREPGLRYVPVGEGGSAETAAFALLPLIFILLLFLGIMGVSQILVNSTLEEKSNRIYEVLLSSMSAREIMTGKILGACGVGFTLLFLWSAGGLLAASLQGVKGLVDSTQILWFGAFYLLGFILLASLMVAVGSACNSLKEAQNLMAPISMFLALPVVLSLVLLRDPNGEVATVLSFVPPFTPFIMMARLASVPPPPAWQVPAAALLLLVASLLAFELAARVFRTGVLLYGQPATFRAIWRALRQSEPS